MLAGTVRIRLLRCLHEQPGHNVTELAQAVGIGVSDASQELRRIQSRGLLQADRRRSALIYRFGADPQVRSAVPLLKALRLALAPGSADQDGRICAIAQGLGHPKRIAIVKSLIQGPKSAFALQQEVRTSFANIRRHLQSLSASGLIRRTGRILHYVPPTHPVAKALVKLLPD